MRTKFFSTVFFAILLTAIPVLSINAALSPVNEGLNISGSASTLQHAPTGNILKKFRKEDGKWARFLTVDAEWFCRVTMSATVYGHGNVSVVAVGDAVHRADGSLFIPLSPDVTNDRVSKLWFWSARKTVSAMAARTIKTMEENHVGKYKVTGTGYYKQSTGGDGLGVSERVGASATVSGITSDTLSLILTEIPTFDIAIQCDPAEACNDDDDDDDGDGADSSNPVVSPTPTPTPTDGTPNCPDCTAHCAPPCSCTNSGTCNGTVTDNTPDCSYCTDGCSSCDSPTDDTPNCPDCTSHCSSPCSCTNSGTCNGSVYTPPTPPAPTPSPPPPTTVACGGAAWTGCTAAVSSRTEHKVASCSNCGKHYWTCMSGAVDRHTNIKTCKRSGCGASLTRCQNGPGLCINGGYHWL